MSDAGWEVSKISAQQLVQGYRWNGTQWDTEKMLSDGAFGAMGGVISSVEAYSHYVAVQQQACPPGNDPETEPVQNDA
jgi:hypothetical protein